MVMCVGCLGPGWYPLRFVTVQHGGIRLWLCGGWLRWVVLGRCPGNKWPVSKSQDFANCSTLAVLASSRGGEVAPTTYTPGHLHRGELAPTSPL
jgi:hypothetical protein